MPLTLNTSHPLYSALTALICVDDDGVVKDLTGNQTCTPNAAVTLGSGVYGRHFTTTVVSSNALGVALSPGLLTKPLTGTAAGTTFVVINNAASRVSRGTVLNTSQTNATGPGVYTGDAAGIAAGSSYPTLLGTTDIVATGAHSFGCALSGSESKTFVNGVVEATGGSVGNGNDSYRATYVGGNSSGGTGGLAADYVWVAQFNRVLTNAEISDLHATLGADNTFGLVASAGGSVNLSASGAAVASGSATISSSGGTVSIAIPPLREFSTGVDRSAETGATVFVNAVASNSLVATITGVSFGVSGASVTHASLVAATAYRVTVVLSDATEGTGILTAAAS